ncbi:MAG: BamA/TamA family outer membrane protein [candidate division WOR-3 bacterium]
MIWFLFINFLLNANVTKIKFEGNNLVKNRELLSVLVSKVRQPYSEFNIIRDVNSIIRYYNTQGFFATRVTPEITEKGENVELKFKIYEGVRPRIREIRMVNGSKDLNQFLTIEKNDFFIQEKIRKSSDQIEGYFKDNGYAFASVTTRVIPDSGILIFEIQKDRIYYIKDIIIRGLKFTHPAIITREIQIQSGEQYNRKKILNTQLRIYRLGFFSTVDIEMVKVTEDTLNLIFNLRELKSKIFNWGVGISIPLSFIISLGLEELNLFNMGHRLKISPAFKINIKKEWEAKFDLLYSISYFTNLKLSPSILPFYWYENKQDFLRKSWGIEFRVSRIFSDNIQAHIANKYKYVDIDIKTDLPDTFFQTTNSIKIQLMGDYRNEFFNPHSGIYFVPLLEYAGGRLGGSNHYLKLETEGRFYKDFLLTRRNIIAQRIKVGIIIPTDGMAIEEKYYLGGQYSLRGYPEKSIGPDTLRNEHYGEIIFNYNLEDRLSIYKNLGIVVFLDMGYIDNRQEFFRKDFFKLGSGVGLRYFTPIGPIRADLGFPFTGSGREFYLGIYHIF